MFTLINNFDLFWSIEVSIESGWIVLTIMEMTVAGLIALLYLVYMCFAAPAVHYVRLEKEGRIKRGEFGRGDRLDDDEDGVELVGGEKKV